ncbi:hypothetical protein MHTCC0001_02530 [Flavobacteriaceae bacterium MHTCC 0001]
MSAKALRIGLLFLILIFSISCKKEVKLEKPDTLSLFSFTDTSKVKVENIKDASHKLENGKLVIQTGFATTKPTVKITKPHNDSWGLEGYHQVKADVTNVGDKPMQAEMYVGNDPDGLTKWYCSNYVDLKPGETKTITVNLAWTPWVFKPQLEVVGMRGVPGKIKTDIDAIKEIAFCSRYASTNNTFTVDNVRAEGVLEVRDTTDFFPFVDEFGQYKHKDWKGKVHSVDELKAMTKANTEVLDNYGGTKNRSKYGGWATGPKLEATGFFRTEKYNDKWWMVDPEGYLFWTAGVNCVSPNSVPTGLTLREHYYETLPSKDGRFGQFYGNGGRASHGIYSSVKNYEHFNFYKANLYKTYGDNWLEKFSEITHKRFKSWGLNTIGFVSEKSTIAQQKTPYVGSIWIRNTPKIEGSQGFWGKFHDVFDPKFREIVKTSMQAQKFGANDPWCIGYFVDNELAWGAKGSLAMGTLKSPATQPAKQEFVKDLQAKYVTIKALNTVWGTTHKDWDALLQTTEIPDKTKAAEDIVAFYEKIADTYFRILKEELNIIAPNQNYLGCRFAWANNDVVLTAASKYMDVMSFNKYEYSVEDVGLPEGVDKPIMIGEFHFGALDRGSFHVGIKEAKDQSERGDMYQDYIQGALRNPLIVGAHWFQYLDEPLTGRFDGENYNVGLIDICNNPYEELVSKIRETTYGMYNYRMDNESK